MKPYRRTKRHSTHSSLPRKSNEQAIVLAGLNVMQMLEESAPSYLQSVLCYGPGSFVGENHASVLIWYRRKGYQNYRELTLAGVWAVKSTDATWIITGKKQLLFSASIYNAESYHSVIKQTFKPYYGDDTSPPPEKQIVYRTKFDVSNRIALRRELAEEIRNWFKNMTV